MTIISIIVAMDEQRGIGYQNNLLCHLSADLKYFKKTTMGKPIIMGYNTYQAIGKALPGRLNIVLSRTIREIENVTLATSLDKALNLASGYDEIIIIGGSQVYKESLPLVNRIYLTKIHHTFLADTFFPEFNPELWGSVKVG